MWGSEVNAFAMPKAVPSLILDVACGPLSTTRSNPCAQNQQQTLSTAMYDTKLSQTKEIKEHFNCVCFQGLNPGPYTCVMYSVLLRQRQPQTLNI